MAYYKSGVDNYYIIDRLIKYTEDKGCYKIEIGYGDICICIKFISEIDRKNCYLYFEDILFNKNYLKWINNKNIEEIVEQYNGILEE